MSSLTRMLSLLDLFSSEHTALTADEIAEELGLARTTCYRYIRELMHAGLLVSNMGLYGLGPRIIQLDYRMREADPLLNVARDVLADLVRNIGGIGLLATMYNDQIVNIHQEGGKDRFALTYSRGKTMPTFRGASSKVILAHLKQARLKRIWKAHQQDPEVAALGRSWDDFWQHMQEIKHSGYRVSHGELDEGAHGIAAPILFRDGTVAGSMTLVFSSESFGLYNEQAIGAMVLEAARQVGSKLPAAAAERSAGGAP